MDGCQGESLGTGQHEHKAAGGYGSGSSTDWVERGLEYIQNHGIVDVRNILVTINTLSIPNQQGLDDEICLFRTRAWGTVGRRSYACRGISAFRAIRYVIPSSTTTSITFK
eukprot:51491-Amorphochlora_amoeboformis.AAC.1